MNSIKTTGTITITFNDLYNNTKTTKQKTVLLLIQLSNNEHRLLTLINNLLQPEQNPITIDELLTWIDHNSSFIFKQYGFTTEQATQLYDLIDDLKTQKAKQFKQQFTEL